MTAKVLGVARLKAQLKALPKAAETAVRAAIAKSADEIVASAKSFVPVDRGDLRDSIGWAWGLAPKGSVALGSVKGGEALTATIFAGDDKAYYARWVEFGTTAQRGQPFFFPAFRANKKTAINRIKRAMGKAARAATS